MKTENKVTSHQEAILCPECSNLEHAKVEHTDPFYTKIHQCKNCDYIIMESEWCVHYSF